MLAVRRSDGPALGTAVTAAPAGASIIENGLTIEADRIVGIAVH